MTNTVEKPYTIVASCGFAINSLLIGVIIRATKSSFAALELEIGFHVWMWGMTAFYLVFAIANRCGHSTEALVSKMLSIVNDSVEAAGSANILWMFPLFSGLNAYFAYFVAHWVLNPSVSIICGAAMTQQDCTALHASHTAILDNEGHCCYVRDATFDITYAFSVIAGNAAASAAIFKVVVDIAVSAIEGINKDHHGDQWVKFRSVLASQ